MAHDADVLGELLGREHDFDFLWARLEKESGDEALRDELAQLEKLIRKRGQTIAHKRARAWTAFLRRACKGFRQAHLHLCRQTDMRETDYRSG